MMFSQRVQDAAREKFNTLLPRVGEARARAVLERLEGAESEDAACAARWVYANSPLSDWLNYDDALFHACAAHGVYLRAHSPYARDIPEDIFLNYVLHPRVNEEELCDCRSFFYGLLRERLDGLSDREAALEVNYWNAEHMAYRSTDTRTVSAMTAYRTGYGRCGEESVLAVNVFRSVGIPARQIYTPCWAHCDDNHAWVEVYCGGDWHFLGACEPEEVLDRGWFTNAAARAMVIHSRCFGEARGEEVISRAGMVLILNQLGRYARTRHLTVSVRDGDGRPLSGVRVTFRVLNGCEFAPAAVTVTDADGLVRLTCGLGSLLVHADRDGVFTERMVYTPETDRVELVLRAEPAALGVWEDFKVRAPNEHAVGGVHLTEMQKRVGREKTAAAHARYERRTADILGEAEAAAHGFDEEIRALLRASRGNAPRLAAFLREDTFPLQAKRALLRTLTKKDLRDVDPDILREALALAQNPAGLEDELFYSCIVCPRIWQEPLSRYRVFILEYFSQAEQAAFREDPRRIWDDIRRRVRFDPSVEYERLVTLPVGALTGQNASGLSQKILFAAICRTLGVAARLNPVDQRAEYWCAGRFVPLKVSEQAEGTICFRRNAGEVWQYHTDFAVGRLEDGAYQTLELSHLLWEKDRLEVKVPGGRCRVLTDNRLPNGDIHASGYYLDLGPGETAEVDLHKYPARLDEMLDRFPLEEFTVTGRTGETVSGSELTRTKAVLMWLEVGKEPTEHILNEMLEQAESFRTLAARVVFLLRQAEDLENETLRRVLGSVDGIEVCFDPVNGETVARQMFVDPEKLPLIVMAAERLTAVCAFAGYNVGSAELIVKICSRL